MTPMINSILSPHPHAYNRYIIWHGLFRQHRYLLAAHLRHQEGCVDVGRRTRVAESSVRHGRGRAGQFLADVYKFKVVSVMELMRFEEGANSPESLEIKKVVEEKGQFSSKLVLRVIKKVLSLYGPRKYLVEGFPRDQADL